MAYGGQTDNIGQSRDGDSDVSRPHLRPFLAQSHHTPQRLLSRRPQVVSLLLGLGKFEGIRIVTLRELRCQIDTIRDTGLRARELEEQMRRHSPRPASATSSVDNIHLNFIHNFHTLHRNTSLDQLHRSRRRITNTRERNYADACIFRDTSQLEGSFGDNSQSSLRSDEHASQIVPSRCLARASASLNNPAISQDHREVNHPVLHRTVPDGIRTTAVRANHTANHGRRTGIHGEEQAGLLNLVVKVHPPDRRLYHDVHVILVNLQYLVHENKVDGHTAVWRGEIGFQT